SATSGPTPSRRTTSSSCCTVATLACSTPGTARRESPSAPTSSTATGCRTRPGPRPGWRRSPAPRSGRRSAPSRGCRSWGRHAETTQESRTGGHMEERTIPALPCISLTEALDFYGLLGFEVTYQQKSPNPYGVIRRGGCELHLFGLKGLK